MTNRDCYYAKLDTLKLALDASNETLKSLLLIGESAQKNECMLSALTTISKSLRLLRDCIDDNNNGIKFSEDE